MTGDTQVPLLGSCRLVLTVMVFFGVYHLMALRFNLSMALVCMTEDPTDTVKNTTTTIVQSCPTEEIVNETLIEVTEDFSEEEEREFSWSKQMQGAVLSSFFYGYILTQIIGGYLSDKFGGKTVFLLGMTTLSSCSMLIPLAARLSPYLVLVIRVIQGLASGLAFPSLYNLFSVWTSAGERATLMSLAYAGIPAASVLTFPLSSWLCQSGLDGGWPMTFYVPGTTGLVWCFLFYILIYSTPKDHPRISKAELEYLSFNTASRGEDGLTVPWLAMLRSPAVHVLWFTHLCSAFGFYLLAINLTLFIREALGFRVTDNGLLSSLPTLGMLLLSTTGRLFDWARSSAPLGLGVTSLRKIFNSLGFFIPALAFICVQLLPCHMKVGHVILIALGMSFHQLSISGGFYFSHAEVAGPYSGVLFGITNTMAQVPGFLTPVLVSWVTMGGTLAEWYRVFTTAGLVYIAGGLAYLGAGTSELQDWAKNGEKVKDIAENGELLSSKTSSV